MEIGPFAEGKAEYKNRPYGPKTADSANSTQSQNERCNKSHPVKLDTKQEYYILLLDMPCNALFWGCNRIDYGAQIIHLKSSIMKQLTDTTGTVTGGQEVKDFINTCNSKFDKVYRIKTELPGNAYLQYTLLTNNRIRLYY